MSGNSDSWFVSPFNEPGTAGTPVTIHDCSIRETEQQPGIDFTLDQKLDLAGRLAEAGVSQIEAGIPALDERQRDHVAKLVASGIDANFTAVCGIRTADVEIAADCGVWGVLTSVPAGILQLRHKAKIGSDEALERAAAAVGLAKERGLFVILSMAYATRASLDFLTAIVAEAAGLGVDRIRVVDSPGAAAPEAIELLVRVVDASTDLPIEVHCHDDFGLATANSLRAVRAGADVVSCSLGGFGPRAGNAALEEVVLALELLYGRPTGVQLDRLVDLVRAIEGHTGRPFPGHKAVSGSNLLSPSVFAKKGADENPLTSQSFLPGLVGHR